MSGNAFICAAAVWNDFELLQQLGVSLETLEQVTGILTTDLENPDTPIPMDNYVRFEQSAPTLTGIKHIGLQMGGMSGDTNSQTGIVGYIAANSTTVREGFKLATRYTHLLSNAIEMTVVEDGDRAEFCYKRPNPLHFTVVGIELALSRTFATLQWLGGAQFELWGAHFTYPAPEYVMEYEKRFGRKLQFDAAENKLVFAARLLDKPTPNGQPYLKQLLLQQAQLLTDKQQQKDSVTQEVQAQIINHLPSGDVSAAAIAAHMGYSRQTIYRRLKEEGTSFQTLLDQIRQKLANHYLQQGYTMNDIAFLLGFSESSAFHRAFKRWYGENPTSFKDTL